jgi:DNA-binding MarR family transcriptional regulator
MAGARGLGDQTRMAMTEPTDEVTEVIAQWRVERPDLDPEPMAIFGRVARIFYRQRDMQARVFTEYELTTAAFDLLANLRRSGKPHRKTPSSLASSSLISTGGVTFRMDGLESAGLIRRVRDPNDRRIVYAELTPKGFAVVDEAVTAHVHAEHEILKDFTPTERVALAQLLAKLEAALANAQDHSESPTA